MNLASQVDDNDILKSVLPTFGINYEDLAINEKIVVGDDNNLNITGFTEKGLSMSDSTLSIVAASDSSNINLKMNIPEVSYTDFENTIFTFKNLDLSILPSSSPQSLEFSAVMDSLEIITEKYYVNLKGLNLLFKSFPDNGVSLDIGIDSFIYPDFNETSINFEDIDLSIALGVEGQPLDISVNLAKLNLLNKNYRVNLSDLDLGILLNDLELSSLDLSILLPDFHYTNFDDVIIDMDGVDVSLEHTSKPNSVNVIISMDGLDATGLNSFDELFPMIDIIGVNVKAPSDASEAPIKLTGLMSLIDITQMDLTAIGALLSSGFDLDTYMSNMPDYYKGSLDGASGTEFLGLDISGIDFAGIFKNIDYSCLDTIKLDLTGLLDSTDIDLADFGIDVSDYDLSAISMSDLIDSLGSSEFVNSAITAVSKLFTIDFDKIDLSGLIVSFDKDKFDLTGMLTSLNISEEDITGIIEMLTNSGIDFGGIFKNIDLSCLGAIVLDLTGLIDSLGIDPADLGIDLSDYDLSAISLAELIGIISTIDFDMDTLMALVKLLGIDLGDLDLSGLIASFDVENFDISSLLASLNISTEDLATIMELFTNSDIDWAGIFENFDFTTLDAIKLDLTGVIDSIGIDLAAFGIDLSDYDLSSITISELMGIISNFDFDMETITALLKLLGLDLEDLDLSGLIAKFDEENFDPSSLLASLNLSGEDISGMIEMFSNSDIDWAGIFENCDYSSLEGIELDLTGLLDSAGIDLAAFGIDVSDYDLSAISLPELIGIISGLDLDLSQLDLSAIDFGSLDMSGLIASFDEENFDPSSLLASLNLSEEDISGIIEMFSNLDLGSMFENIDLSCLGAIVLDLTGLIDSLGIDLAAFGIDLSDYDLSAISLAELIGIISSFDLDMNTIAAIAKLFGLELDDIDFSGLIASFDAENFDISAILAGLNLSDIDISAIMEMFSNLDLAAIFENIDLSCLGTIVLDLTRLIDSLGVDPADLGIDLSDYDLSAISLAELIGVLSNLDFDMNTLAALAKLFGLELGDIDLSGIIASFDEENFDLTSLLASLNLSDLDISAMMEMFNNMDTDFAAIFENFDDSCLDAFELDLTGLLDSTGIDLADFGMDVSNYDLSSIRLSEIVDIICDSEFIKTSISAMMKLFQIDWNEIDFSSMIASFDAENFDMSGLLNSLDLSSLFETLDLSGLENTGIFDRFDMNGFDLTEFMNGMIISFMQTTVPEDTSA